MIAKIRFSAEYGFYNDFLNDVLHNDIPVYSVKLTEFGFTALCYARDYKTIARMARRFQCRVRIMEKKGLFFVLYPYRKRKGILAGAVIFPLLCFVFSCMIWKIDINTDDRRLKNILAHSLYNQGIYPGNICTKEKLTDVQRQLMLENKNLGYVTLNFYKGILTCEVYSRNEKQNLKSDYSQNDIYSRLSGIVTDIRVYSGFSRVQPGQSVMRGDVLVTSARIDAKGRLDVQDTAAYIAGDCEKEYRVFIPYNKTAQVYTGHRKKDISVSFMGGDFCLAENDLSDFPLYTSRQVITGGEFFGFAFPFTIRTVTYNRLEEKQILYDFPTARKAGETQLRHLIANDLKLEKEYSRRYDYAVSDDGVTAICRVEGRFIMT